MSAITALVVLEATGAALLTLCVRDVRRFSVAERLGSSFGLGLVGLTTVLFGVSLAGLAPAWWIGVAAMAVLWLAVFAFRRDAFRAWRSAGPQRDREAWSAGELALLALIAGIVLAVTAVSLLEPLAEWDVIAIWAYKAKILLHEPVATTGYFHDRAKAYSHLDYPLLWPLSMTWVWTFAGTADPEVVKVLAPALLAALLGSFYGFARRVCGRTGALTFTALLAGVPLVLSQTSRLLADAPLAFFTLLAFGSAFVWLDEREEERLRLAGLFVAGLVFTKNEGLGLAAILVVALLVCGAPWRAVIMWAAVVPAAIAATWLVYRAGIPKIAEDYGTRINPAYFAANLGRIPEVARGMIRYALELDDWVLFWPFVALTALWRARELVRPPVSFLALALALSLMMYACVYVVTPWDVAELMEATAARLLLHVTPLAMLLVALIAPRAEDATGKLRAR